MAQQNIISYRLRPYFPFKLPLQPTYSNINILDNIFPLHIINQNLIFGFEEQESRIELICDIFL